MKCFIQLENYVLYYETLNNGDTEWQIKYPGAAGENKTHPGSLLDSESSASINTNAINVFILSPCRY